MKNSQNGQATIETLAVAALTLWIAFLVIDYHRTLSDTREQIAHHQTDQQTALACCTRLNSAIATQGLLDESFPPDCRLFENRVGPTRESACDVLPVRLNQNPATGNIEIPPLEPA